MFFSGNRIVFVFFVIVRELIVWQPLCETHSMPCVAYIWLRQNFLVFIKKVQKRETNTN